MDDNTLSDVAKALGSPTRVAVLRLVAEGTLCGNAIACRLGITPGAVSQHLRVLKQAGLVEPVRRGYFVHYALRPERLQELAEAVRLLAAPQPERGPCPRTGECSCEERDAKGGRDNDGGSQEVSEGCGPR